MRKVNRFKGFAIAVLAAGLGLGAWADGGLVNTFEVIPNSFGNLLLNIESVKAFLTLGYELGDAVDVSLVVYGDTNRFENVPVLADYSVRRGRPVVWCSDRAGAIPGFALKNDNLCTRLGITNEVGVLIPQESVSLTISLRERGTYLEVIKYASFNNSTNRQDYASDVAFANYREVRGGGIVSNILYRGAAPCEPNTERSKYVSKLMGEDGITNSLSLSYTDSDLAKLAADESVDNPYWKSLYFADRVRCFNMGVDYAEWSFKEKVAEVIRRILSVEGPSFFHCVEGRDRTGFLAMLLESFAGATPQEVETDYMTTYKNTTAILPGTRAYEVVRELYYLDVVELIAGGTNITSETLWNGSREYLESCELTAVEMEQLWILLTQQGSGSKGLAWKIGATDEDTVVAWTNGTGTLIIEGEGRMKDFASNADLPWPAAEVTSVTVAGEVTGIGLNAWSGLADTVTYNGLSAQTAKTMCNGFGGAPGYLRTVFKDVQADGGSVQLSVALESKPSLSNDWTEVELKGSDVTVDSTGRIVIQHKVDNQPQGFYLVRPAK